MGGVDWIGLAIELIDVWAYVVCYFVFGAMWRTVRDLSND